MTRSRCRGGRALEAQTPVRRFQRPVRDVEAGYCADRRLPQQSVNQSALAATEVEHLGSAKTTKRSQHCLYTLLTQSKRGFKLFFFLFMPCFAGAWVRQPGIQQLAQRLVDKAALVLQVAARDELPQRMAAQPTLTEAQQLVHLVVTDPVVLVAVQDGQKHVQVGQQVTQPGFRREAQAEVWAGAPLGKTLIQGVSLDLNGIAKRLEQLPDEVGSLLRGRHRYTGFQRDGPFRQLRPLPAISCQGAAEYRCNRHAQVRRRDVGAVVHILLKPATIRCAGLRAHQAHRVYVQQKRHRAAMAFRFGVKDISPPERKVE